MRLSRKKISIVSSAVLLVGFGAFAPLPDIVVGTLGLLLYTLGIVLYMSHVLFSRLPQYERLFWSTLVLFSCMSILTTITYYSVGMTPTSALILCLFPLSIFFKKAKTVFPPLSVAKNRNKSKTAILLAIGVCILEGILFVTLISARTVDVLPSPWQALEPWFFVLYAVATALVIFTNLKAKNNGVRFVLTSAHLFITFGVAAIIYTYGFGFDGFIHRATELWIERYGFILPKQPFYIGQYSMIVWLAHLTSIPIFFLDVFFVPVLSALILPPTFVYTLRKIFSLPDRLSVNAVFVVPLLYFLTLNLTTPHNLVILLTIIILSTTLAYLKNGLPFFVPFLLALSALATHPLISAPTMIFLICAGMVKHTQKKQYRRMVVFLSFLGIALFPTALFSFNNFLNGYPLPTFTNPLSHLGSFFSLFQRPYWYAPRASFVFEVLYAWQFAITPLILLLGLCGAFFERKKNTVALLSLLGFFGFVSAAWLLRSWVVFPNVIGAEQGNYPVRLLSTSVLFLVPLSIHAVWKGLRFIKTRLLPIPKIQYAKTGLIVVCSLVLMLSFYFSYPQRNQKVHFPGFNVTQSDFDAVRWIHEQNQTYTYIVLANPLVSMAALTEYSFAKHFSTPEGELFYYAIPSGGSLYRQYDKMVYEGQKREYMEHTMALTGAKRAYFVMNSYWKNFDTIVANAKKTADGWQEIDGGNIMVLWYDRKTAL